jgi:glycosyltransferase involved in cell wall biosynthesis
VDSGSTDRTIPYAEELGVDVYRNPWPGFAGQRNWSLDNAGIQTEWVLFVDADEIIPKQMQEEIRKALSETTANAFYTCFKVMLFGKWVKHSSNFPVWHPRIVRFGKVRYREAATGHGETWTVEGNVGYIREPYVHYAFSKGLTAWFEKHNRNSTAECNAFLSDGVSAWKAFASLFDLDRHKQRQALRALSYYLPCRPLFRFVHQFLIKGGILDGPAGWTYCSLYFAYEIMISSKVAEKRFLQRSAGRK